MNNDSGVKRTYACISQSIGRVCLCVMVITILFSSALEAMAQQVIKLPDGRVITVPSNIPPDQLQLLLRQSGAVMVDEKKGVEEPDEKPAPAAEVAPAANNSDTTKDDPETAKARALMQALMRVRVTQRNPSHMLSAWAKPAPIKDADAKEGDDKKTVDHAGEFQQAIMAGDWDKVGEYFQQLPPEMRKNVFDHLLRAFLNPKVILLPNEVLALAKAYDHALLADQIEMLAKMIQQSIHLTSMNELMKQLNQGVGRIGGTDTQNRANAARLLIDAGYVGQAQPFLPPLEMVRKNKQWDIMNLHAKVAFMGAASNPQMRNLCWELCNEVLANNDVSNAKDTAEQQKLLAIEQEVVNRMLSLLSMLPAETSRSWLKLAFVDSPPLGRRVLAQLSTEIEQNWIKRQAPARLQDMKNLSAVINGMLKVTNGEYEQWLKGIRLLSLSWIREAEKTNSADGNSSRNISNAALAAANRKTPPIDAEQLIESNPGTQWMQVVGEDVGLRLRYLSGMISAKAGDLNLTLERISEFIAINPARAGQLADALLVQWGEKVNPNNNNSNYRSISSLSFSGSVTSTGRYYPPSYYYRNRTGIPLTRAQQQRNLLELSGLLDQLNDVGIEQISPGVLVNVFANCHSDTEVYRLQDIAAIFGDVNALSPDAVNALATNMRGKLATQWRNIRAQQQAGTKRTDKQIVAEVRRGYEVVTGMIDPAVKEYPEDIQLAITQALVYFDMAEFEYGQNTDLETYIQLRERSFKTFNRIADIYNRRVTARQISPTASVYMGWFRAALGASDLALMTRQDVADSPQLKTLIEKMKSLPDPLYKRHVELFGAAVDSALAQVPPHLKPRFIKEAITVIGDHASADKARELLSFYDDLLSEVLLHAEIDGGSTVGHGKAFGVHLMIRYTEAIARESGGFNKYLHNKVYTGRTNTEVNFKDDLKEHISDTLSETFEVVEIRFHDPQTQPTGFGRAGWRQTPLAYIVLKAKDPSVDQIPSLRIDADFSDSNGYVILPITSQVVALDAKSDAPAYRPVKDLEIKQILDDRKADEGVVRVEVIARGKGVIPELSELLDVSEGSIDGFKIDKIIPNPLSINKLIITDEGIYPEADRNWVLELKPAQQEVDTFVFPALKQESITPLYQRYADADIVKAGPSIPLNATWANIGNNSIYVIVGVLVLVAIVVGLVMLLRKSEDEAGEAQPVMAPNRITPFSTVSLLRSLVQNQQLKLSPDQRQAIEEDIREIETRYFSRQHANTESDEQLNVVVNRWIKLAS